MNQRSNLSAAGYLLLVFLSGVLVGVFSYRLYMVNTVVSGSGTTKTARSPDDYRKKAVEEMTRRLKLSPDQVSSLQSIMDETRQHYRDVHERQKPELKTIETEHHQKIMAMLNEGQRAEYLKMHEERERRRQAENQAKQQQK